jgi:HK97 family phage major capsid protein
MGAQMIYVDHGSIQWPVVTSEITAGWQTTELGNVPGPQKFKTTDRALSPDHTLGVHIKVSRKALKQAGEALEQAVRRDMQGAIGIEMDRAVFTGTGTAGQPLGVVTGAATYGITTSAVGGAASWPAFRGAAVRFMLANTAGGPGNIRALIRPELWASLDGGTSTLPDSTEWNRLVEHIPAGNIVMSPNALPEPSGETPATSVLLTTTAGGVPPIFVGLWAPST